MSMQSEDLDAIDAYVKTTDIETPAARVLRDQWIVWWDQTGWWDKQFNADILDIARNKKNAFNLANAKNEIDRRAIREQLKTAFTTEEASGAARRMLSDGTYSEQHAGLTSEGDEPFFPTRVKIAGGVVAAVVVALWTLKKIYVDPFIPHRR